MGLCQSADGSLKRGGAGGDGDGGDRPCPTVFELERIVDAKRGAAKRLHVNLVNIEFRSGLFEVYRVGCGSGGDGDDDDDADADDDDSGAGCGGGSGSGGGAGSVAGGGEHVDLMAVIGSHGGAGALLAAPGVEAGRKKTNVGGEGIFVVTHKCTGRAYGAREVAVPASRSAREVDELWKAFDAQAALDHPNICRLQEIFCSEGRYYVVTDLCSGGNVMERLAAEGRTSYEEHEAATLVGKLAGALSHCHAEGVIHGNLRVESCHFEDTGRWADIKIVDAGLNRPPPAMPMSLSRAPGASGSTTTTWGGSAHSSNGLKRRRKAGWYMPPEVRSAGGTCTEAGDMWMLGVLAWLILTGPLPQPGMSQESAWAGIMVGKPPFKGEGWAGRSPQAVDFVSRLLQKDVGKRMTMAEALEHPWLRSKRAPSFSAANSAAGNENDGLLLSPRICSSLHAFKESCVMRRLGLRLVGRTLEASKLFPVKEAFHVLDPYGKGYITEDALAKGLRASSLLPLVTSSFSSSSSSRERKINGAAPAGDMSFNSTATPSPSHTGTPHARADNQAASQAPFPDSAETEGSVASGMQGRSNSARAVHELFEAMDPEGAGRVGFSTFLAACLAGKSADEVGARVAFSWLDRRRKGAINSADMKLFTGEVLQLRDIEDAFTDAHDALDLMSIINAGPVGSAVREMEARRSAASGAAGGFTYAEFYRLLAAAPPPPSSHRHSDGGGKNKVP
ncbi:unnamed protein product [Scytosiphon promiscuus]